MKCLKIQLLLFVLSICFSGAAQDVFEYSGNTSNELKLITPVYTFKDTSGKLSAAEVINSAPFTKVPGDVANLGVSPDTYWIKFKIRNSSHSSHLLLEIESATIHEADFYTMENGTIKEHQSGVRVPINHRKYKYPGLIFDADIPLDSTKTFFIKVRSGDIIVMPIRVGNVQNVIESNLQKEVFFALYAGIILSLFLYNLFIYFTVKDNSYLYYVTYIIFVGLTQLILQGYSYKYLWPESPWMAELSIILFPALAGIGIALFTHHFLNVKEFLPRLRWVIYFFVIYFSVAIILRLFNVYNLSYNLVDSGAGIISLYCLIVAIIIFRKGSRSAAFFLFAWSIFLIGVFVFVLRNFGVLPFNNFTNYTMPTGNALEVILLSLALADRINILKKEKEESQAQTLLAFKENERIITEQNLLLEGKVKERTAELEESNRNLKEAEAHLVNVEKMASLGQLTAGISHEINNPINFVIASVKPLKRDIYDILQILGEYDKIKESGNLDAKLKEIEELKQQIDSTYVIEEINLLLKGIEEGATRTSEIVKGLKVFSRTDEAERKKMNIHTGLDATLSLLNSSLAKLQIRVEKDYGDIPEIECFPGKLNQVFMNLLNNGIQAIAERKPQALEGRISIKTRMKGNEVEIDMSDNGVGIPAANLSKIFEPFFTTKEVGTGTGLGLSIVYGIIKDHHGEIKVESTPGQGTTFKIILPCSSTP